MAGLICDVCGCEFAFHLYKTCRNCEKIICPACTRIYYKHCELPPQFTWKWKFPFLKSEVCFQCYEELEREEEERKKKEEERAEQELREEEEIQKIKYICTICGANNNKEEEYMRGVPLNEFPDVGADRKGGRRTLPIVLGKAKASKVYSALTILVYLWIICGVAAKVMPTFALIALLTLPLAVKAIREALNYEEEAKLLPALGNNVFVVLLTQLLLGIGYIIARMV